jgi:hypothetical protein
MLWESSVPGRRRAHSAFRIRAMASSTFSRLLKALMRM